MIWGASLGSSCRKAGSYLIVMFGAGMMVSCAQAPAEPEATATVTTLTQSVVVLADAAVASSTDAAVAPSADATSSGVTCGVFPPGERMSDHPGFVYAMGWAITLIEPTEAPRVFRERLRQNDAADVTGASFQARVVSWVAKPNVSLPGTIEVHQWDAIAYRDRQEVMEPLNGSRGRAVPRPGARFLALILPDGVLEHGWRMVQSWEVRADGTLRGPGLGLQDGANIESAMTTFRHTLSRPITVDGGASMADSGVGVGQ